MSLELSPIAGLIRVQPSVWVEDRGICEYSRIEVSEMRVHAYGSLQPTMTLVSDI